MVQCRNGLDGVDSNTNDAPDWPAGQDSVCTILAWICRRPTKLETTLRHRALWWRSLSQVKQPEQKLQPGHLVGNTDMVRLAMQQRARVAMVL